MIRKDGERLILTPIRKTSLMRLLASWELDEGLPDIEDGSPRTGLHSDSGNRSDAKHQRPSGRGHLLSAAER